MHIIPFINIEYHKQYRANQFIANAHANELKPFGLDAWKRVYYSKLVELYAK